MSFEQVALQLGLAGVIVWVWYRLEMTRLAKQSVIEAERTAALTVGFQSLGGKIDSHTSADLESHAQLSSQISRVEGKFDGILDAHARKGT